MQVEFSYCLDTQALRTLTKNYAESRFDVALVNGTGQIEVLENAFAA